MDSLVLLATVVISGLIAFLVYLRRFKKPANSPPYEAGLIPYLGNGLKFGLSPVEFTTEMYKKVRLLYYNHHLLFNEQYN